MFSVMWSLHDGMSAEVTVNGQVAPEFEVRNDLRQECVIAPTLFNLYSAMVMEQWRIRCSVVAKSNKLMSIVCVREHSDESKTLIDTDVSPLVRNINNCDLVRHLWQRSII